MAFFRWNGTFGVRKGKKVQRNYIIDKPISESHRKWKPSGIFRSSTLPRKHLFLKRRYFVGPQPTSPSIRMAKPKLNPPPATKDPQHLHLQFPLLFRSKTALILY